MPIDPATGALIASSVGALANLGAGYFGGKDIEKANRENRRRAAMSNLIRSFGVDHRPVMKDVELGKTTRLLQGIGKGANVVGTGLNLYNQLQSAQLQDQYKKGLLEQIEEDRKVRAGRRAALGAGKTYDLDRSLEIPKGLSEAPKVKIGDAPSLSTLGRPIKRDTPQLGSYNFMRGEYSPEVAGEDATSNLVSKLSSLAKSKLPERTRMQRASDFGFEPDSIEALSFSATMSDRLAKEQKELADLEQVKADTAYKLSLANKDPKGLTPYQKAQMGLAGRQVLYDSLKEGMPNYIYRTLGEGTWGDFSAESSIAQSLKTLTPTEIQGLRTDFVSAKDKWAEILDEDTKEVLRNDIKPLLDKDQLFKYSGGLRFAYLSIAKGYLEQTGQGDIAMIIGLARLKDPGVSVRAEDVNTEEKAITKLESLKLLASGERIWGEGGRMLPEVRRRFMSMGQSLYQGVVDAVNDEDTGLPHIMRTAKELTKPGADLSGIDLVIGKYNMPSIDSYGVGLIDLTEKDRAQIGSSRALTDRYRDWTDSTYDSILQGY